MRVGTLADEAVGGGREAPEVLRRGDQSRRCHGVDGHGVVVVVFTDQGRLAEPRRGLHRVVLRERHARVRGLAMRRAGGGRRHTNPSSVSLVVD